MFTYMWEYRVKKHALNEFQKAYGSDGPWVRFFKKADGYLGTELHQDLNDQYRFVTIDYWQSKKDCYAFRAWFSQEFERLDTECEELAEEEIKLGSFLCLVPKENRKNG